MTISEEDIRRITTLARIEVEPGDRADLAADLGRILEHMEVLAELAGGESDLTPQLREALPSMRSAGVDAPDELTMTPDELAPRWEEGFFVVPPPPGLAHRPSPGTESEG